MLRNYPRYAAPRHAAADGKRAYHQMQLNAQADKSRKLLPLTAKTPEAIITAKRQPSGCRFYSISDATEMISLQRIQKSNMACFRASLLAKIAFFLMMPCQKPALIFQKSKTRDFYNSHILTLRTVCLNQVKTERQEVKFKHNEHYQ